MWMEKKGEQAREKDAWLGYFIASKRNARSFAYKVKKREEKKN